MAASNPSRIGQINQAGDTDAIFLKVYGGEVLTAFERKNVMMPWTFTKTISSGKSAQFPRTGLIDAEYHTPGAEITGNDVNHSEIVISVDDLLLSPAFIALIDEAKNHYDVRRPYSNEQGIKLATTLDKHLLIEGVLGARLTVPGSEVPTETPLNGATTGALAFRLNEKFLLASEVTTGSGNAANIEEKAEALIAGIFGIAKRMDENDVDDLGRWVALRPQEYYVLVEAMQTNGFSAIHSDIGGRGSIASGTIPELAGLAILKSNNVPKTDTSTPAGLDLFHGVDAEQTVAVAGQMDSIGVVKLLDLAVEMQYDIRRQGTLMVAKYAIGMKYLRPEALIELKIGTGTII